MDLQKDILLILVIGFILFETIFSLIFLFLVFKFVKETKKRNKIIIHYVFLSFITLLFIVLAIVHHLLNV